jgi:predicted MFS family arabinose efflux permease
MRGVWASLWITLAIQALVSLVVFTPPVLAPAAQAAIGVSASSVGVVTALIYLSAMVGALRSGGSIARYGPTRVSQTSLVLCGAGIALIASGWLALIALGALVIGMGYGAVTPASSAILADRAPPNLRAFIFSLKQTGVPIGGALAGVLVPVLIGLAGWDGAALAAGAGCVLTALALQPMREGIDRGSRAPDRTPRATLIEPLRLLFAHAPLRELSLASFTYSGMQMCLGSFLVVFLHERAGFSVSAAGATLATAMAAGIGGRVFWGVLADRAFSPQRLLGVLGVCMSGAAILTALISPAWPALAVAAVSFVYGGTAVGWNGVYLSEIARIAPQGRAAAATGASIAMTYAGVVAMPAGFWLIVVLSGSYAAAFVAAAALTAWRGATLLRRHAASG